MASSFVEESQLILYKWKATLNYAKLITYSKKEIFLLFRAKKNYFWRLGETLSKLLDSSILRYSVFVVNLILINVLIFLSIQGQVG